MALEKLGVSERRAREKPFRCSHCARDMAVDNNPFNDVVSNLKEYKPYPTNDTV